LPGRKTEEEIFQLASLPGVVAEGIFTHFALADAEDKSFTREQLKRFLALVSSLERGGLRIPLRHAANSAAIIDIPETHLDMVRAGIMIYGLFPSPEVSQNKVELRPVMSWKSRIILVKEVGAGTGISYGHTFITARKSLIATVPLGYADGFSRLLSNKACVLVRGRRVPVVGRICMDQFMADVTGVEGVAEGDEVVIFGRQGQEFIGVDELAQALGTINYEVVCMVSSRVPRRYTGA
ncbi:MAG: alanine racemase, partial [Clostridia bacterium]|nr:alanine racemase [Clostridia bacterium]